jgi:hypothetical protein
VLIVYLALILFSVAYQMIRKKFFPVEEVNEEPDVQNEDPTNP